MDSVILKMREAKLKDMEDNNVVGRKYILGDLKEYMDNENLTLEQSFQREEEKLKNLSDSLKNKQDLERVKNQLAYLARLKNAVLSE